VVSGQFSVGFAKVCDPSEKRCFSAQNAPLGAKKWAKSGV
jgi:hypothetical protein